jgi:hypothetical protein
MALHSRLGFVHVHLVNAYQILQGSSVIMYRDAAFSASSDRFVTFWQTFLPTSVLCRWRLCQPEFVKLPVCPFLVLLFLRLTFRALRPGASKIGQ